MKRSLSASQIPVVRKTIPSTSDRLESAADQAPEQPPGQQAASADAEPSASEQATMIFPGPFAFQARPPAMRDNSSWSSSHVEPAPAVEKNSVTGTASGTNEDPVPGAANPHGIPPLILAACRGDLAMLDGLLQDPSLDINQVGTKDGISALMAAAVNGHVAVVARLVAAGAKLALRSHGRGRTALMFASERNKPNVVEYLLAAGAQVNLADNRNLATALTIAAERGHLGVVNLLLAHKDIAVDQTDATGMTALHWAASSNRPEVVACLLAAGARPNLAENGQRLTALMKACWNGHVGVVRALLADKRTAVDQFDATGSSALHWAAAGNRPIVVARLMAAGAYGNLEGGLQRRSPLITAAANGHGEVVKTLLTHKVIAVDLIDGSGQTALHCAAAGNHPEMVACLLASGANVNLRKWGGDAALVLAVRNGGLDVVKTLLAHKDIAVDQADPAGMNALHWAAYQNKPEIVACLLQAGAAVNMLESWKRTALILARGAGHVEVVKKLVWHRGVALNEMDASNWSALHMAAYANKTEVAECLLAAGANVNLLGQSARSALMLAAEYGHVDLVKLLIRYNGFNAFQIDATGQTALHTAVAWNKPDVVACLLAAGANLKLLNGAGISAETHAIVNKQAAVLEVMLRYGLTLRRQDFSDLVSSAFYITMSDLVFALKPPVVSFASSRSIAKFSDIPGQPLAFVDLLLDNAEPEKNMLKSLCLKDVRMAIALPVFGCLANLYELWPKLASDGQGASTQQKRLICAAALHMLPVLTADGKALAPYKAAGISAAGVERLSTVATHQLEAIIDASVQVLTTMGTAMVNKLVLDCMAGNASSDRVDINALRARLVDAGWLAPVAQAIAVSWKSALAALEAGPAALPASSSINPASTSWRRRVVREAPRLFAPALSRELDSPSLIAALRTLIGDNKAAEPMDILFQAQCDQLRQFCEQTGDEG